MLPLVAFHELVEHYAPYFADVLSAEALIQFKRYISGLIVSENKTVDGINRLFIHESRHQSSLNRLLTESPFSLAEINQSRLAVLESVSETGLKPKGVLSVDDTLLTHYGHHFDQIAKLYDHSQGCYVWAHNLVTLHYSDDQTDYPLLFELWRPADLEKLAQGLPAAGIKIKESKLALKDSDPKKWRQYLVGLWRRHQHKADVAALYESKLRLAERQLQHWMEMYPTLKLPVTFDSWYTTPGFCHFIDQMGLPYVGTLTNDAELVLKSGRERVDDFAARLKQEHLDRIQLTQTPVFKPVTIGFKGQEETYYSYCRTHRVRNFGKVRLVINHLLINVDNSVIVRMILLFADRSCSIISACLTSVSLVCLLNARLSSINEMVSCLKAFNSSSSFFNAAIASSMSCIRSSMFKLLMA